MLHLGLPVRVGGLMVSQGDLLHGDTNGVTSIPLKIAAAVADIADEFVAAEKLILDYLRSPGAKTVARYGEVRKEFGAVVARLTERAKASR